MPIKKRQSGFILLFSLIMLMLISALSYSSLQNIALNQKAQSNFHQHNRLFSLTNKQLHTLIHTKNLESFHCTSDHPLGTPAQIQHPSWWGSQSPCRSKKSDSHFEFIVEQLQQHPCLQLTTSKSPGINIYRITVFGESHNATSKVILQAYAAKPFPQTCTPEKINRVAPKINWTQLL